MNQKQEHPFSLPVSPNPFTPDWHHQLGEKLAVFPRYLSLNMEGVQAQYWPDLATFTEDLASSILMYYPGASRYSVCVLYWKHFAQWEVIKFDDDLAVSRAEGCSFQEAMSNAAQQLV